MATQSWLLAGIIAVALVLLIVLLLTGYGPAIQRVFTSIWSSTIGRHIIVILVIVLVFEGIKAYSTRSGEQKASEWLTSYNGVTTTDVVGRIEASVPGILPDASPTPSASPTVSPTPSPTPSPSPSPTPDATPTSPPTASSLVAEAQRAAAAATPTPSPTPTKEEKERIDLQLRIIRDRVKHHGDVMAYFYVNYFLSIVMVMVAGLTVALTLFFIAQLGWNNTNSYIRSVFVVAAAYAAFYGLFPPVFQQQKNIIDNKELFLKYKALESEVDSYDVTFMTTKGEAKNPREFITYVDSEMSRIGNIALGFDITKVSYQQAFDLEPRPSPDASPTPTPTPPVRRN
jgi:hypothetical protein